MQAQRVKACRGYRTVERRTGAAVGIDFALHVADGVDIQAAQLLLAVPHQALRPRDDMRLACGGQMTGSVSQQQHETSALSPWVMLSGKQPAHTGLLKVWRKR